MAGPGGVRLPGLFLAAPAVDSPTLLTALILGIVEGLTEFLPVSSTGHLIVAGSLLGYTGEQAKTFEIVIQAGAILAVCWEYRARLASVVRGLTSDPAARRFVVNLFVAFLPAAVLGLAVQPRDQGAPLRTGARRLRVHRRRAGDPRRPSAASGCGRTRFASTSVDAMRWTDALLVGCAQALALVPGTSRSGATIIGGMLFGLSRVAATEFSFFLAIPTLFAATGYSLWKDASLLSAQALPAFGVGFAAAFVSAFACVRWLIRYVSHHDFIPFAWYRIAFGAMIFATAYWGLVRWD